MKDREYIEEITDPVTGEVLTLRATTEAELDAAVAARFGRASVGPASLLGRSDLRRTENHPHSTVVPLSDPPTHS